MKGNGCTFKGLRATKDGRWSRRGDRKADARLQDVDVDGECPYPAPRGTAEQLPDSGIFLKLDFMRLSTPETVDDSGIITHSY